MKKKNWSEKIIEDILAKHGENWHFVEMFSPEGERVAQAKSYDPPAWVAYPDFEKRELGKVVLLVEVKGYNDFFRNSVNTLAMKQYQYAQYFVVQRKESAEVRVVFVIKKDGKTLFFWEKLDKMSNMEKWFDIVPIKDESRQIKMVNHVFWNTDEFRTDIENLGV